MSEKMQKGKTKSQQIEYLKERLTQRNSQLKVLKKKIFHAKHGAIPVCREFLILHEDAKNFTAGFNDKKKGCSCNCCEMARVIIKEIS